MAIPGTIGFLSNSWASCIASHADACY